MLEVLKLRAQALDRVAASILPDEHFRDARRRRRRPSRRVLPLDALAPALAQAHRRAVDAPRFFHRRRPRRVDAVARVSRERSRARFVVVERK